MLTARARADIEATVAMVKSPHLRARLLRRMTDTAYAQQAASEAHAEHVRSQPDSYAYKQLSMGSGYRLGAFAAELRTKLYTEPVWQPMPADGASAGRFSMQDVEKASQRLLGLPAAPNNPQR